MRKLLLLTLILIPILGLSQTTNKKQEITKEVSANGSNLVEALFCKIESPSKFVNAGVTPQIFYKGKQPITYGLCVQIPDCWVNIEEGAPIIVKLKSGSIVEGKAIVEASHDAYDYRDLSPEYYYKYSKVWYGFDKESIDKIRNEGFVKLRVSDGVKFYDYQISENVSNGIIEGYSFLEDYIKSKPSIYDDF